MVPREIEPLVSSLNLLLTEIVESIEREKRFTSNAAHELRTPLAAIRVHAQVLLNARSASEAKEAALDIITGVDNASRMIAQLLTLARLDPVTPTHEVYFNLAESIESAIKQMNYKLEEAEAHLFLNLSPTYIHGQPDQIEILVRNLLENAILYKSINERPEIRIGCGVSTDSQKIYMSVQDNGIGISKDYLPYIFQRFYRIPGSPSSGSGLGLSIVKQIADRHRATISITSSPRNTVFKIEFPS
jgi:signal transduction histidine kinase